MNVLLKTSFAIACAMALMLGSAREASAATGVSAQTGLTQSLTIYDAKGQKYTWAIGGC